MGWPFLYDTHYQVNRPLALLDLTLATASPTAHATDEAIARRLETASKKARIQIDNRPGAWLLNKDAMRYWIGNCHDGSLLSRQNAYDYWLMNFHWITAFSDPHEYWGQIRVDAERLTRLLLLRWAWSFDSPMLSALLWRMQHLGTCDMGDLVAQDAHHVEDVLHDVFAAARESIADPRERTTYRQKLEELRRGFKYNTRRHKVVTHLALLCESGLTTGHAGRQVLHPGVASVMRQFASGQQAAAASLQMGQLGPGGTLFVEIAESVFAVTAGPVVDLGEAEWLSALAEIRNYWSQIEKWDRKFLGIQALAELLLVKNLESGRSLWSLASFRDFLSQRARYVPEELTVHVDRFGRVEYLRLASVEVTT